METESHWLLVELFVLPKKNTVLLGKSVITDGISPFQESSIFFFLEIKSCLVHAEKRMLLNKLYNSRPTPTQGMYMNNSGFNYLLYFIMTIK